MNLNTIKVNFFTSIYPDLNPWFLPVKPDIMPTTLVHTQRVNPQFSPNILYFFNK